MLPLSSIMVTSIAVYAALLTFIIFHEKILIFIGNRLCQTGRHSFKKRKYHCKRCKKGRDWPKLTCIDGEKKDKPIFPKI